MFEFWLADENLFFSGAFVLMLALGVLQLIGLSDIGPDFGTDIDPDIDIDGAGAGLLALFGFGRLPMIMLLVLFLTLFAIIGLAGQEFYEALFGHLLTPWLAVPAAAAISLPITGMLARPLARIMPHDETTAIDIDWLVGRRAIIQIGTARAGYAARAKVSDRHGHDHFVMVEPQADDQSFAEGEEVLMVSRDGEIFKAIAPEAYKQLAPNR